MHERWGRPPPYAAHGNRLADDPPDRLHLGAWWQIRYIGSGLATPLATHGKCDTRGIFKGVRCSERLKCALELLSPYM
jgi:hypothetical protein